MKPTAPPTTIKKSGRHQAEPDFFDTVNVNQNITATASFSGTTNPRALRALNALLKGPVPREALDKIAGCSNGPALVASLRTKGLGNIGLACTMVPMRDRDGNLVKRGVYTLSPAGLRAVVAWTVSLSNSGRTQPCSTAIQTPYTQQMLFNTPLGGV